jgi:hypothetical protein
MFEEYGGPVVRLLVSRGIGSSIVFTGYSSRILFRGHPQWIRINLSTVRLLGSVYFESPSDLSDVGVDPARFTQPKQ